MLSVACIMSRAEAIAAFQAHAAQQASEARKNPAAPPGIRSSFRCKSSGRQLSDETWSPDAPSSPPAIDIIYLHGACESADSLPVRNLASVALKRGWRLRVPEHHGHGESDGTAGVVISFDDVVIDAADYIDGALKDEGAAKHFVLVGHSMGATAAAYLGGRLRQQHGSRFLGAVMIAPAVGADPDMLPNVFVLQALRVASWIVPSFSLSATPFEEPAGYCASDPPPGRSFRGHWPLRTARVLLDLTIRRVPEDCVQPDGFFRRATEAFPVVVATGRGDAMVPDEAVADFVDAFSAACAAAKVGG